MYIKIPTANINFSPNAIYGNHSLTIFPDGHVSVAAVHITDPYEL